MDPASLDREQKADLEIMKDALGLALLELNTIQSYKHNPTIYVELAGNALFNPYMLNYAPKEKRFQQITRRLEKMPALFEQAKSELVDAPEIWNRVAQEENDGNIELIDKTLRAEVPEAQKAGYNRAAGDGHRFAARLQRVSEGYALQENQRLAAGQGQLRQEISIHAAHRKSAGAIVGRGRSGAESGARGDGQARRAEDREAGSGRHRHSSTPRRKPIWTRPGRRWSRRRRSCAKRGW